MVSSHAPRLRHKHDLRLPECALRLCRIDHGHLAIVLSRWKLREVEAETKRHRSKTAAGSGRHRYRLRLEDLGLIAIETDERDEWPGSRCRLLVRLQIDIHLPPFA